MALTVTDLAVSRSQRILGALEELGEPYSLQMFWRHPQTKLSPPGLKEMHPLGQSPVMTDGELVVADSDAMIADLVATYGALAPSDLFYGQPSRSTQVDRQCRLGMHYAEGPRMHWSAMKLVFDSIPRQPMPFFVRPIARELCS